MNLTELRNRVFQETRNLPHLTTEDIDAALDLIGRVYIQPVAHLRTSATRTTTADDSIEQVEIVDMYELQSVVDETEGTPGYHLEILGADDLDNTGVRLSGGLCVLQYVAKDRKIRFTYDKLLTDVTVAGEPEIDGRWHDLYWMGAAAHLNPANPVLTMTFRDRLQQFKVERQRAGRGDRRRVRIVKDWV